MTAEVANLLAEIRRSGGEVRLLGCDKLKLVAPAALLPELTEPVRAAKPMLLAALAATGRKPGVTLKGGGGVINPWRAVEQRNPQSYRIAVLPCQRRTGAPDIARRWLIGAPFTLPARQVDLPGGRLRTNGTCGMASECRIGSAQGAAPRLVDLPRSLLQTAIACTSTSSVVCSLSVSVGVGMRLPRSVCLDWRRLHLLRAIHLSARIGAVEWATGAACMSQWGCLPQIA
jgi:hypothetical protein